MAFSLSSIHEKKARLRDELASLEQSSVDDTEAVAVRRGAICEQLALLGDLEAAERARLKIQAAAAREKSRYMLLMNASDKARELALDYDAYTTEVSLKILSLVNLLAERERLITLEAIGLDSTEAQNLITPAERRDLLGALASSFVSVNAHQFSTEWRGAAMDYAGSDSALAQRLIDLLALPPVHPSFRVKGLSGSKTALADMARRLAATKPREEAPSPCRGSHQVVNLRHQN